MRKTATYSPEVRERAVPERAERHQAVATAVASQRLEGLEPDAELIRQLQAFAEGREAILGEFRGRIVDGQLLPAAERK